MENHRTITDLPLEVLDLIFKELWSMENKLRLAITHEKLGKAFSYHSRNTYKSFRPWFNIPEDLLMVLLRECGPTIVEFVFANYAWSDVLIKAVELHCPNLRSAQFVINKGQKEIFEPLLLNMRHSLTSVEIIINDVEQIPKILKAVSELTNLKKFWYLGYSDESFCHLQHLVSLEELRIECRGRKYINLLQFCGSLTNLRRLTVINSFIVPPEEPAPMVWISLEELILEKCEISTELPDCPKLRRLKIQFCQCEIDGLVYRFILKNKRDIESIDESCNPPPYNAERFLQVLRDCPKLRILCTPMNEIKIYQGYVSSIVEILRRKGFTREDPFKLDIYWRDKWKWIKRLVSGIR
ncbi:hypothetical protein KR009_003916 [Drosophila setifemur]|nr:hypothetical protein KR009_003916 [Drosophila setifemur]